jgi:hypothetical protein
LCIDAAFPFLLMQGGSSGVPSPNKVRKERQVFEKISRLKLLNKTIKVDIVPRFGLRLTARKRVPLQLWDCVSAHWEQDSEDKFRWYFASPDAATTSIELRQIRQVLINCKVPFVISRCVLKNLYSSADLDFLQQKQQPSTTTVVAPPAPQSDLEDDDGFWQLAAAAAEAFEASQKQGGASEGHSGEDREGELSVEEVAQEEVAQEEPSE